ncbi:MAG: oligosaccharide flippase family protein [Alistipes sp.]|nr:oligosaccharide flippase family protein [Alistipes sp.]
MSVSLHEIINRLRGSVILRDSSWAIAGNAVGRGLSMIAGIVVARWLGAEIYGEYGLIKSTLAYVATFATFGLGYATTKYVANRINTKEPTDIIVKVSLYITFIFSVIMALCLWFGSEYLSDDDHIVTALKYTSLIIVFYAINNTQIGLLAGFGDFRAIAINNAIVGVATFVLSVALTFYYGLEGAAGALFSATVLQCVLNHISVRRHRQEINGSTWRETRSMTGELLRFSFPIALQESVSIVAELLRMFMIINIAEYKQWGLFTASNQWYVLLLFIPGALRNVILSHLSGNEGTESHERVFNTMLKINLVATAIPAVVILCASPLISYFYGSTFTGFTAVLIIAIATSLLGCAAGIYTQEFFSRGKNWTIVCGVLVRDMGALVLSYPLLRIYGREYGAAIMYSAILLTHLFYCVILHMKYRSYIKSRI